MNHAQDLQQLESFLETKLVNPADFAQAKALLQNNAMTAEETEFVQQILRNCQQKVIDLAKLEADWELEKAKFTASFRGVVYTQSIGLIAFRCVSGILVGLFCALSLVLFPVVGDDPRFFAKILVTIVGISIILAAIQYGFAETKKMNVQQKAHQNYLEQRERIINS